MKKMIVNLAIILSVAFLVFAFSNQYPKDSVEQYDLAKRFEESNQPDYKKALELYQLSAGQDNADAQYALGLMYYYGEGVAENISKALAYFEKSASQGHDSAQTSLAEIYHFGKKGIERDHLKAMELYKKAAIKNNDQALYQLARLYKKGDVVKQDYVKAIEFYQRISDPKSYNVFHELASFHDEGKGVIQDHDVADELYRKADKLHYEQSREIYSLETESDLRFGEDALMLAITSRKAKSFFGAKPQVFSNVEWPKNEGIPLAFIGQLDLSEINRDQVLSWLPNTGRLLFFYDIYDQPWGIESKDQQSSVVLYDEGIGDLKPLEYPVSLKNDAKIKKIKYLRADDLISYPSAQRASRLSLVPRSGLDIYYDFLQEYYKDPHHQAGGYPSTIQDDSMEYECKKIDFANTSRKSEEGDWKLLLQFDSDDSLDVMWGDVGKLYFWVRESDARKRVFSKTCVILQSY